MKPSGTPSIEESGEKSGTTSISAYSDVADARSPRDARSARRWASSDRDHPASASPPKELRSIRGHEAGSSSSSLPSSSSLSLSSFCTADWPHSESSSCV